MNQGEPQWEQFLARCLATRLDVQTFSSYAKLLSNKTPLPSRRIAAIFLKPEESNDVSLDPRVPLYLQALQELKLVDVPSILRALIRYSTTRPHKHILKSENGDTRGLPAWKSSYASEEVILSQVARSISSGITPKDAQEAVSIISFLSVWISALLAANVADDMLQAMDNGGAQNIGTVAVRIALGRVLVALADNAITISALQRSCPKDVLKSFTHTLSSFTPSLMQNSSPDAERLELFRNQVLLPLQPVDPKEQAANAEIDQIIDSSMGLGIDKLGIIDLPVVNYRAGLYIYLNALTVGKPNVDDSALYNFLQNRYQGDVQAAFIDLILASFDVLLNATFRNEGSQATFLLRSFLINKVPVLLTTLAASTFPPLNSEFCITEALSHVDTNAFPTFSSMFDESSNGNMFSDSVRQDFCFACCLHGLIPEHSIERLLGEIPMQTLPEGGRYVKDDLVRQCLTDPERAETLIDELERTDGNVGAASQALVEVMRHLAISQDTMSLKALCTHLARKPSSLDVILLFNKSGALLQPICNLLDTWHYEEDQGEYQPVYEQFGAILLLVLAFVHRYNLNIVDLGLISSDSFVAKLLERGATSRPLEDLSDLEKNHLDGWIRGLFDGEGGGLGDELMSSCPPQDFYLLVPTLFHQIVIARSTNNLSEDSLKGGLEYLVDIFLLPSLVGAITWLSRHIWSNHSLATTILQIVSTLIKPISISNEASLMHGTILNIIAKPLEYSLRSLQRQEPSRQDVEPLSSSLKPYLIYSRTSGADHTEVEDWAGTEGMGMVTSVTVTIAGLVEWCMNRTGNGDTNTPASYTRRKIFVAVKLLGAKRLLHILIQEVKEQTAAGNGSAVVDVIASLICAQELSEKPHGSMQQQQLMGMLDNATVNINGTTNLELQARLTLKEALSIEVKDVAKIHKVDVERAEAMVRLYRRVEALTTLPPQTTGMGELHDGLVAGNGGLGLGDGALGVGVGVGGMGSEGLLDEGLMDLGGGDDLLGDMKLGMGGSDFVN